ncbi:FtsX-like permease family protein [Defluviitalea phaphyphila]|uniref:FtsX-like permease family protein n=1 Tax=Defluviitalea phaphyphila TaxID=1473580 RepID=UPI00072FF82C|nr:FtsX-like permease family protein [Defluviitalea phaphyphila]
MNKTILLPKLSILGIKKNGTTYFPYILSGIISVFVFFIFSSIIKNDIMNTLPHSSYLIILMNIGLMLLRIILILFLIYTNSFLIKRRKKELGLYNILGLEKKHIILIMIGETLIIFLITLAIGILSGIVFSKLAFVLLLNLSNMPVDIGFTFNFKAYQQTFYYFLLAHGINLVINIFQIIKSNPKSLMQGEKEGDKDPKYLWIIAIIGIAFLGIGYYIANIIELNSMFFINIFVAILLVILGTHSFFRAGIIALLKIMKINKNFYYNKSNYVTISGMIYRMKKNTSSLANICIFSTMVIITLLCTLSLWSGMDQLLYYQYPYDVIFNFDTIHFKEYENFNKKLNEIIDNTNINIENRMEFTYQVLKGFKNKNSFVKAKSTQQSNYNIKLITLEDFNKIQEESQKLENDEIIIITQNDSLKYDTMLLNNTEYKVKKIITEINFAPKTMSIAGLDSYLVVKNKEIMDKIIKEFVNTENNSPIYTIHIQLRGEDKNKKEFIYELNNWCKTKDGFINMKNGIYEREESQAVYGGLLFIGIFFGIIFSMCLILIMYYKQITEGFEDQNNFSIMQKIGMSDKEMRATIKQQILLVFFIPLIMAIIHTIAGFKMIVNLMKTIYIFDRQLIILSGSIIVISFAVLYILTYIITSRAYYNIVKDIR